MKLGISYNLFEGEELLEACIRPIRHLADHISVIYQKKSHFGDPCSDQLMNVIDRLIEKKYIDEAHEYFPEIITDYNPESAHNQNIIKRNMGLEISKNFGCSHYMSTDVDEFYLPDQFEHMKKVVENGNYDASACQHSQYYKDEVFMTFPKEQEFVNVINKINKETAFVYNFPCKMPIDPSRKTNNRNYIIFSRSEVEMHHLSFVRKNLKRKLMCSFARIDIGNNIDKIVEYYDSWKYPQPAMWAGGNLRTVKKVERKFNIWE